MKQFHYKGATIKLKHLTVLVDKINDPLVPGLHLEIDYAVEYPEEPLNPTRFVIVKSFIDDSWVLDFDPLPCFLTVHHVYEIHRVLHLLTEIDTLEKLERDYLRPN